MSYTGFYINLDRSADRRAQIEAQLAKHKLEHAYARFKAADGNALDLPNPHLKTGEMGCFTSHYLVMKKNLDSPKHLHIVEDDVIFSSRAEEVIRATIDNGGIDGYDLVFTDTYIPINVDAFRLYKELYDRSVVRDPAGAIVNAAFSVIDLSGRLFATTSSYLVNAKSIRKLYNVYTKEITNSPRVPIDLLIRNKAAQGIIKVGCIFPFVTSIRLNGDLDTTIAGRAGIGRYDKLTVLAGDIARHSFFIDGDIAKCRDYAGKLLPPDGDAHRALLTSLLGFALGPGYQAI
ncbi:MAG TPA: glycosyltransferase family 25 protein [Stellaceae bacterium]|nr:glycosyltransferase family 25 protein [Stellaceae bacterium]